MKKILCSILTIAMLLSFCSCGQTKTACNHDFEATISGKTVTLKCKLCSETASADVELPQETVEVEKEVEKIVEKEVIKTVFKEKKVEVPVYLSEEEKMEAEDYEMLSYYKDNYAKIDNIRTLIENYYYKDVDENSLMEAAYSGMVNSLGDEFSVYTPAQNSEEYINTMSKSYSGIGVSITPDDDNNAVILELIHNSPAEGSGLQVNDVICEVDGVSVLGQGIDIAANAIRGEIGTYVNIKVLRNGEYFSYNIMRRQIATSTVEYGVFLNGIGYIAITGFNSSTPYEMSIALTDLEYFGCTKCVIDLRDNGGGMVDSALYVADMLMDEGVMTYIEDKNGDRQYYRTYEGRTSMEYTVLCNGNSASASEMLLAGVQDNKEGIVIGTKTYGKGIVQVLRTLPDGSSLNLTQYQYYSPNGNAIHGNGITPDYVVDVTEDCFNENGEQIEDPQLMKAFELLFEE